MRKRRLSYGSKEKLWPPDSCRLIHNLGSQGWLSFPVFVCETPAFNVSSYSAVHNVYMAKTLMLSRINQGVIMTSETYRHRASSWTGELVSVLLSSSSRCSALTSSLSLPPCYVGAVIPVHRHPEQVGSQLAHTALPPS